MIERKHMYVCDDKMWFVDERWDNRPNYALFSLKRGDVIVLLSFEIVGTEELWESFSRFGYMWVSRRYLHTYTQECELP